jgi:hypothetical protein
VIGSEAAVQGVLAWARATLPDLMAGYAYEPLQKGPLPDVVVLLNNSVTEFGNDAFFIGQLQQVMLQRYDMVLSIMVDNTDPEAAASTLRSYADLLRSELFKDGTLGQRVPVASPLVTFDYSVPFVEYADGSRGREMTMTMSIADPLGVS